MQGNKWLGATVKGAGGIMSSKGGARASLRKGVTVYALKIFNLRRSGRGAAPKA